MRFSANSSFSLLALAALLAGLLIGGIPSDATAQSSGSITEQQEDQMMSLLANSPALEKLSQKAGARTQPATTSPETRVLRSADKARAASFPEALGLGSLGGSLLTWLSTTTVAALGFTVIRSLWWA